MNLQLFQQNLRPTPLINSRLYESLKVNFPIPQEPLPLFLEEDEMTEQTNNLMDPNTRNLLIPILEQQMSLVVNSIFVKYEFLEGILMSIPNKINLKHISLELNYCNYHSIVDQLNGFPNIESIKFEFFSSNILSKSFMKNVKYLAINSEVNLEIFNSHFLNLEYLSITVPLKYCIGNFESLKSLQEQLPRLTMLALNFQDLALIQHDDVFSKLINAINPKKIKCFKSNLTVNLCQYSPESFPFLYESLSLSDYGTPYVVRFNDFIETEIDVLHIQCIMHYFEIYKAILETAESITTIHLDTSHSCDDHQVRSKHFLCDQCLMDNSRILPEKILICTLLFSRDFSSEEITINDEVGALIDGSLEIKRSINVTKFKLENYYFQPMKLNNNLIKVISSDNLRYLNLESVLLGKKELKVLTSLLVRLTKLQSLYLQIPVSSNMLHLASGLRVMKSLEYLNLNNKNGISEFSPVFWALSLLPSHIMYELNMNSKFNFLIKLMKKNSIKIRRNS